MKRSDRWIGVLAAGLLVAGLTGCASRASNVLEASSDVRPPSGPDMSERVIISASGLGRKLVYGDVATRREGLLFLVQVTLENKSKSAVNFEYRWEWTDAEGFQVADTLSSWQPGVINGRERKLLSATSPGPAAANFRLYLRSPGE